MVKLFLQKAPLVPFHWVIFRATVGGFLVVWCGVFDAIHEHLAPYRPERIFYFILAWRTFYIFFPSLVGFFLLFPTSILLSGLYSFSRPKSLFPDL